MNIERDSTDTSARWQFRAFLHLMGAAGLFLLPTVDAQPQQASLHFTLQAPANGGEVLPAGPLKVSWHPPRHPSMVAKSMAEIAGPAAATPTTIPLWIGNGAPNFPGDQFMMVGLDPSVPQQNPASTIKAQVIPVKFIFSNSLVFDPTKKDACTPQPALNMVQNLPVFKPVTLTVGGTLLGTGQFESLFQRGNFWAFTGPGKVNPKYEVNLTYSALSEVTVEVQGGLTATGPCDLLGAIGPTTLPILLFYNVVMYDTNPGNCCVTCYHNALLDNAMHLNTYVVSDHDETGIFGKFLQDIMSMSRDIGEWMDDPTGGNPTPPWENIGQVTGCQSNLDVGDPLSGTVEIPSSTKTVCHVQDLAFKSWFYHDVVSTGVNGWYSLYGNFRAFAASCQSGTTTAFAAEPNSGAAPLLVNFRASPAVIETVDFGDGTTGTMEQAPTFFGCPTLSVAGHVYQSTGTYTARLVSAGGPLGSQVITVTNR
jgi:hypothetical protein